VTIDSPLQTHLEPPVVLEARSLKRHYGNVLAVDGVDLNVRAGEIYGFLGINGAGKSTTIRILMGIISAEAGTIRLLGKSSSRTTVKQKQQIGYVSQEQNFYPWMSCQTLGRFVGSFYPSWDKAEFYRLLELFGIPASRRVSHLSGGMRAKLALAMAIAPHPQILILDEPTAGLDPVARRDFMEIIVAQARQHQRTTFFSSHLIDEVERCADRIGIIQSGRMRFEGSLDDLRSQVRRVTFPEHADILPTHFELWNERVIESKLTRIYRTTSDAWSQLEPRDGLRIDRLSLEEIFIACVGSKRISL
jgi:ABC-2 type transport system ATP-binding protein